MLGFKIVAGKREPKTFKLLTAALMGSTGKSLTRPKRVRAQGAIDNTPKKAGAVFETQSQ